MPMDQQVIADFRRRLREAVENNRETWTASRRLVAPSSVAAETLRRLHEAVAGSSLDPGIRQKLLQLLAPANDDGLHAIPHEGLRELTGLNPTKAVSDFVQADRDRLHRLRRHASPALRFRYDGNRDMLDLASWRQDCARYTIAVCNSPATPTFAYEPSRLGHDAIRAHLRQTKGEFRRVQTKGLEVLEDRKSVV